MKKIYLILVVMIGFGVNVNAQKAYASKAQLAQGVFQIMKNFPSTNKNGFVAHFIPVIPALQTLQSQASAFNVSRADHESIYDEIKDFTWKESVIWQDVTFSKSDFSNFPEKATNITFNRGSITVKQRHGPDVGIGYSYYEHNGKFYVWFIRGVGFM